MTLGQYLKRKPKFRIATDNRWRIYFYNERYGFIVRPLVLIQKVINRRRWNKVRGSRVLDVVDSFVSFIIRLLPVEVHEH